MIRLLIIDGMNLVRRIYSALPVDESGNPNIEHFLHACKNAFRHNLEQHQPSHAVCVFEHYTSTWRHRLYPPYKANRKPQPEAMLASFERLDKTLNELGIHVLQVEGYEADDIIASIVHTTATHDCQNLVISTDHVMAQLLDEHTRLFDHFAQRMIDEEMLARRYGVKPAQLLDYFTLVGSSSVNIPGISGIGAKTAQKLLQKYGDCDALIEADDLDKRTTRLLEGAAPAMYLYRGLFHLREDCPIHSNLKQWRVVSEPATDN